MHPKEPTIQFNLACYATQMGNPDRAKVKLAAATRLDSKNRLMALEYPDLEQLWEPLTAG